jgi:hypothetical protein
VRKLFLVLILALAGSAAGLFSPAPAKALVGGGNCVSYCNTDACGFTCCSEICCNGRCFFPDCAPPPPCDGGPD